MPNEKNALIVELRLAVLADSDEATAQFELIRAQIEASDWFSKNPWMITVVTNSPSTEEEYSDLFYQKEIEDRRSD